MKYFYPKFIFIFCCTLFPLWVHGNIDSQIEAIRNAPTEERFRLMNAFKQEIVEMKEEERIHAITQLKSITRSKYGDRALREIKTHAKRPQHKEDKNERRDASNERDSGDTEDANNENENNVEDEVGDETEDEIENDIEDEVEDETENEIENDIEEEAEDEDPDDD
jgi:hypothetical protein